jgi:chromatin remodeling complex protein RSC6
VSEEDLEKHRKAANEEAKNEASSSPEKSVVSLDATSVATPDSSKNKAASPAKVEAAPATTNAKKPAMFAIGDDSDEGDF